MSASSAKSGPAVVPARKAPAEAPTTKAARLLNLGVAYMNQQRMEQALKMFEQAAALDPALFPARLNQGIALLNLQRPEPAKTILLEAVHRDPKSARGWYNLGLLYRNVGQAEESLDAFRKVAALDPVDPDTHYFLATLYLQQKQHAQAVTEFERTLELAPFHVSAEFGLARAYQRLGEGEKSRQHLARFEKLTQEKLGAPMSLIYGEQGKYSLAEEVAGEAVAAGPAIRVRFVPATAQAGLQATPGERKPVSTSSIAQGAEFGPGACFLDYDGDGRSDLLLATGNPNDGLKLYRNLGNGRFQDVTRAAGLRVSGLALGCVAGDYDNDGKTDLAISFSDHVALFRNLGNGHFAEVTKAAGLTTHGNPLGLTFVDYDHDGDLDLYVATLANAHNVLWRNNGNGTFTDVTEATGLGGSGSSIGAAIADLNRDRAVDLVVTGGRKAPMVYLNPREGKFDSISPWTGAPPEATAGVVVLDFDKDGWPDLAFTHWGSPGISLWRNIEGRRFERVPLPDLHWTRAWGIAAVDYDNDGWIDLVAVGEKDGKGEIRLLRNLGGKGFEDVSESTGLTAIKLNQPRAVITADYDGDGDTDLLITQNGGPPVLLRNDGGNRNHSLCIALKGLADNKSAIGTKVEVFAGAMRQHWEVQSSSGYLGQSAPEIVAGLGQATEADVVRLLWPTGVLQDEVQLAAGRRHVIEEIDRRGSSCPTLFVWNGERYELVADMIGAGVVGHWVAPGQTNDFDPTEYVKVEGARARLRNGRLSFRFMEPMEEVVYLDQVKLLAVDHPADADVYPNERFLSAPPFPDFAVITSRGARPPAGAWDGQGRNVLPQLLHRDHQYVTGFKPAGFAGFTELHTLELDLGAPYQSGPLRLLLHGFIEYFTANSMYAAYQAGMSPIAPYVEAQDSAGRWVRVVDDMGFPAGLARTMVADLSGRLPAGTRRIRIVTNLEIYWDQILIDTTQEKIPVRVSEVPLAQARLAFHGYPRVIEGKLRSDFTYDYEDASQTGPYARAAGNYTRYGDVLPLLTQAEDKFVIFGSGDEVALEFDPTTLPAPPAGWTRDYFFFADGFEKDMDFYAFHGQTVEPLPYHAMGRYPYPADHSYPAAAPYVDYQLDYNTRGESGKAVRGFRFSYRRTQAK
ncbi:MAG TPA: FG-GAP-like repeat-containing protein [Terriglobales bacterium]|nr:FG-GAP-like repeat-containing protein [Terriglobales bacterium]